MSKVFKGLTPEQRKPYEDQSTADKERYQKEKKAYEKKKKAEEAKLAKAGGAPAAKTGKTPEKAKPASAKKTKKTPEKA